MTTEALTFDTLAAEQARESAISIVTIHADTAWLEAALLVVQSIANRQHELTTDDVWKELEARGIESPHEKRALANAMLRARGHGWIAATERTVKCSRPVRNAGSVRVWRSLVVSGSEANR